MLTDWPVTSDWEKHNFDLTIQVGTIESSEQIRVGGPIALSVWETVTSLAKLFPHRRKVIYFKHQDPLHEQSITALAREGYDVCARSVQDFGDGSKWFNDIDKETLGVLYSIDDPFFGRVFPQEGVAAACAAQRAFAIQISHHGHRLKPWTSLATPFSVEILAYANSMSCIRLGEKARVGAPVSALLRWRREDVIQLGKDIKNPQQGHQRVIEEFENKGIAGAQKLLSLEQSRHWDRAVLFWPDVDGHAVAHYLAEKMGEPFGNIGEDGRIETTSLSRWQGIRTMDWLRAQGYSPEQIRGAVIIHHSLINSRLDKVLAEVYQKIIGLQKG